MLLFYFIFLKFLYFHLLLVCLFVCWCFSPYCCHCPNGNVWNVENVLGIEKERKRKRLEFEKRKSVIINEMFRICLESKSVNKKISNCFFFWIIISMWGVGFNTLCICLFVFFCQKNQPYHHYHHCCDNEFRLIDWMTIQSSKDDVEHQQKRKQWKKTINKNLWQEVYNKRKVF